MRFLIQRSVISPVQCLHIPCEYCKNTAPVAFQQLLAVYMQCEIEMTMNFNITVNIMF